MRGSIAYEVASFQSSLGSNKLKENSFNCNNNNEPISVLDSRSPSTSPSTSTSTPSSSSVGGGGNGCTTTTPAMLAVSNNQPHQKWPDFEGGRKDEWPELQPIPAAFELQQQRFGAGLEDWESLLSESPAQDQSLRWISGDFDDTSLSLQQLLQSNQIAPHSTVSETPVAPNFNPQNPNLFPFSNSDQNPAMVQNPLPQPSLSPYGNLNKAWVSGPNLLKSTVSDLGIQKVSILNQGHELLHNKSLIVAGVKQEAPQTSPTPPNPQQQQQQLICDHLSAAAELILYGNCSHAQGILARLNHQLASALAPNNPFQRAAFCFKEAMQIQSQSQSNPVNGLYKMGAYKMFSEVSPAIQFMNFTSSQTLLEALGDAKEIHILDFDIGFGAQWASLIRELPTGNNTSLKITAFASPSTHHAFELGLMQENLSQLAKEIGLSFELEVVNFDSFDPRWFSVSENETIAVNFPIWSACTHLSVIPSILHFVKQLSPRIVVSFDRGCERMDLSFPHYLQQGLQYYEVLLDSINGANVGSEVSNKIERYLIQSQIERMVLGKLQFPEPMPHWKSLFKAAGYSPVCFSSFAETQAECVLKRIQVQGFRVEKRQASLVLCWQNRELMTASAWKC